MKSDKTLLHSGKESVTFNIHVINFWFAIQSETLAQLNPSNTPTLSFNAWLNNNIRGGRHRTAVRCLLIWLSFLGRAEGINVSALLKAFVVVILGSDYSVARRQWDISRLSYQDEGDIGIRGTLLRKVRRSHTATVWIWQNHYHLTQWRFFGCGRVNGLYYKKIEKKMFTIKRFYDI